MRLSPVVAAALTGVQVGAAMVASRFALQETGPVSLALLRYIVGFLCLLPAVLATAGQTRFARRDLVPIALLGIGQFGILIALLNLGLRYVPSGRAALVFASFPLLTLCLAATFGYERMTLAKATGVLLTLLGVGVALGASAITGGGHPDAWIGDLFVLASALTGAACSVFYRPYLRRYPPVAVSAFAMLASVLFLAVLAAGEGFYAGLPRFGAGTWLAVLFIGASSGIGYFLWLWALRHADASRVTAFLALSPLTAALLGALLLAERLTLGWFGGFTLVLAGLLLATREPRKSIM